MVQKSILDELECRKSKLKERLTSLRTESEEIWKSMETAERSLNDIVAANDFDTTRCVLRCDLKINSHFLDSILDSKQYHPEQTKRLVDIFRQSLAWFTILV